MIDNINSLETKLKENDIVKILLIEEFKRLINNKQMTKTYFNINIHKLGFQNVGLIKKKFGTLTKFAKEANYNFLKVERNKYNLLTKEEFINKTKRFINGNNNIPKVLFISNLIKAGLWSRHKIEKEFGSLDNMAKEVGFNFLNKIVSKEEFINKFRIVYGDKIDNLTKGTLYGKIHKLDLWGTNKIKRVFGSLDNMAKEVGFNFIRNKPNIGINETFILDNIEKEKGIKLERQFRVGNRFIDGYDYINNIAYEVDEKHHRRQQVEDSIREEEIKNVLDCSFIRIKEKDYINRLYNSSL